MEAYSNINKQESQNSLMTYRFEEDGFKNLYTLEDFYCTNPFCDCNHVTLALVDREKEENSVSFLLNINNRSRGDLPNQKKLSDSKEGIIKEFMGDMADELVVLFKQRYMEAKAFGEKNPMSYMVFEPGRFVNYMEIKPRGNQLLDFDYNGQKYFAEDSYELDPRNDNRSVRLSFFRFDPNEEKIPPLFHYSYYFNEDKRAKADAKLPEDQAEILVEFNRFLPNLNDILKKRYKEGKKTGEELLEMDPAPDSAKKAHRVSRNEMCPCGSGKKYKKCCGLKVH